MSPYSNKLLSLTLAGLLLAGCSGQAVRPDKAADKPAEQTAPLPRDYDKALILMQSGSYREAIPVLRAFIDQQPEHAGPYLNLGIAYRQSGDTKAAHEAFARALELNPDNAAAWHQQGILYREEGNFDAALQAYNQALVLNPDYVLAHRNIGILYDIYLQQPVRALEHYRRYLELQTEPDDDVNRWVVDLERRSGSAQASASP